MPKLEFSNGKSFDCSWEEYYAAHLTKDTVVKCDVLRGTDHPATVTGKIVRFWYALDMLHVDVEIFGGSILTVRPGPKKLGKDKLVRATILEP